MFKQNAPLRENDPNFKVIGVGASAGGLESFVQLIEQLPKEFNAAVVFVQHLDPTHPSLSTDIVQRATSIPVSEIVRGEKIQPNHIYILPPNTDLTVPGGKLELKPQDRTAPHRTIDLFFQSLANHFGSQSIGVVLSGTAMDGTEGLRSIKAEGGITFAQNPDTAKFESMPKTAIGAGVVDFVLSPAEIARELLERMERVHSENNFSQVVSELKSLIQFDLSEYKQSTLGRRINRRMALLKMPTEEAYVNYLKANPAEAKILYSDILIHVTGFFRNQEAFEALESQVYPVLLEQHQQGNPIRIWVAGCSTGEEPYSIAMSLLEYLRKKEVSIPIQIFASDVSEHSIGKARAGIYSIESIGQLPKEYLDRYFTQCDLGYKIHKSIRDLCLFSKHDLVNDPPFAKIDLVSCRNLLIYFTAALQQRTIPRLHYALSPWGFLFLGISESPGAFKDYFKVIDKKYKIYQRNKGTDAPKIHFSAGIRAQAPSTPHAQIISPKRTDTQREVDRIVAKRYGPCGVLVNDDNLILQFRGRTIPYIEQTEGTASHRLLQLAHSDLVPALRAALRSAKEHPPHHRKEGVPFLRDGVEEQTNIDVTCINSTLHPTERLYLVLFEPVVKDIELKSAIQTKPKGQVDPIVKQLQSQLKSLKDQQKLLIEEYEVAQEEVTASNEEWQSGNEELQSSNEELETAKEELQSTNEELITVNDELQNSNAELEILNSDLVNLIGSIEIPIVMLDGEYRIRRFTPTATRLLNIIPGDVGRPIHEIRSNLRVSNLELLISGVTQSLKTREVEVQDTSGHWYRLQIRTYRTADKKIDGVVLAFIDIEALKLALSKLKGALNYATSISDALQIPSVVIDQSLNVKSVNNLFSRLFHVESQTAKGRSILDVLGDHWKVDGLAQALENTLEKNEPFPDFEVWHRKDPRKVFLLSARQIQWVDLPKPEAILISFLDISDHKMTEGANRALLEREQTARLEAEKANRAKDIFLATLSHELRTPLSSILTWAQLIGSGMVDQNRAKEGAQVIERSAKIQSQLIDDLLDISRIITGKLALHTQPTDPRTVIPLAVHSVKPLSDKKSIVIETYLGNDSGVILADPMRFQQIIWNLLTNAIKFSPAGSTVQIRLQNLGDFPKRQMQLQVIDSGIGIRPEFMPHLFDRFSQSDSSSTRLHGGLGLGLSIVRNLVEMQNGTVAAENAKTGTGATFTVTFPTLADSIEEVPDAKNSADVSILSDAPKTFLKKLRILYVDDDQAARETLTLYLKFMGAEVLAVESAQDALDSIFKFNPQILISDLAMPDQDGYSLIQKIRNLKPESCWNVPAIALTAYASEEDSRQALEAGFQAHLSKPVDASHLIEKIRQVTS